MMPGPEPKLHLPYGRWPEADRLLWERGMASDDPFAQSAGIRLAKATQHSYLFGWRRFLGFLAIDEPEALEVGPAERLTIERVRRFVDHLRQTNISRSVASQIHILYLAARVMMPESDWTWLKSVNTRLFAAAPAKAAVGPVITSLQLLDLGQQLMDESTPAPGTPISMDDAICYRDGLMIALAGFIPFRRKELAVIEIGRHLVREGESWSIVISDKETKTKKSLDYPVPELLQSYLSTYLNVMRPQMGPRPTCAALWLHSKGGALAYAAIGDIFARHSMERLGVRVTPHDARDAAVALWAIAAPDQISIARDLLAHSDLRTTIKYYNRARGIEASRTYSQVIAEMRKKAKLARK